MNPFSKGSNKPTRLFAGGALGIIVLCVVFWPSGLDSASTTLAEVKRGDLRITVLEGGSAEALESQMIRSEIEGREGTLILSIVEEGYQVTEEDVANGMVLVELDSSGLENQITQQEITFQSTEASLIESVNQREIQVSQNESNIKDAEQQVRFARLDFAKYMGDAAATQILNDLKLESILDSPTSLPDPSAPPAADSTTDTAKPDPDGSQITIGEVPREIREGRDAGGERRRPGGSNVANRGPEGSGAEGRRGGGAGGRQAMDFSNMTDEQREQFREMMRQRREGGAGRPGGAGAGGGPNGGGIDWRQTMAGGPDGGQSTPPTTASPAVEIKRLYDPEQLNFAQYAEAEKQQLLGDGEASQQLRQLTDAVIEKQEAHKLAQQELDGKKRLFAQDFVTQNELDQAELAFLRAENQVKSSETALLLFKKYDLSKSAEEFLSKYEEAIRGLQRAQKEAAATLAQADAKMKSAQRRFEIEKDELEKYRNQFAKCVIKATTPGLVVYGGGNSGRRSYSMEEQIREGATVRERQQILTIPDMRAMAVKVRIDESQIKKVSKGQRASIKFDAEPDRPVTGLVSKVAVLPDSENRYFNPDQKVYVTELTIDGTHTWLKPGMSAQVEILVDDLKDILYIPLLAVVPVKGEHYCYTVSGGEPVMTKIRTGKYSDEFIEVTDGLSEGQRVMLRPPMDREGSDDTTAPSPSPNETATRSSDPQGAPLRPAEVAA